MRGQFLKRCAISVIPLFFAITYASFTNDLLDEIHLKNRNVITGLILEFLPEKHIVVSVLDGELDTIPMSYVEFIVKTKKSEISIIDKSYFVI